MLCCCCTPPTIHPWSTTATATTPLKLAAATSPLRSPIAPHLMALSSCDPYSTSVCCRRFTACRTVSFHKQKALEVGVGVAFFYTKEKQPLCVALWRVVSCSQVVRYQPTPCSFVNIKWKVYFCRKRHTLKAWTAPLSPLALQQVLRKSSYMWLHFFFYWEFANAFQVSCGHCSCHTCQVPLAAFSNPSVPEQGSRAWLREPWEPTLRCTQGTV